MDRIDHIGFAVRDIAAAQTFYEQALAPLGITLLHAIPPGITEAGGASLGFGVGERAFFWLGEGATPGTNSHVAFAAESRAAVDAFHAAALAAGGRDHGAPGIRAHFALDYYGAFVIDGDGNNIEAVHRGGD